MEELTDQQYEPLRAIYAFPNASQRDITENLGVSASTISQRMGSVDGFDWTDRQRFAEAVVAAADYGRGVRRRVERISLRLDAIERRIEENEREDSAEPLITDPDLAHKGVHACLSTDAISEEERRILEYVFRNCL